MTDAGRDRRRRFLAALDDGEALWGIQRFRLWLEKNDAARSKASWLSYRLSWKSRAALISGLAFLSGAATLAILGESLGLCLGVGLFLGVAAFLFQANWYFQLPETASGGTIGSLLWTLLLGLVMAVPISAVMVCVALAVSGGK